MLPLIILTGPTTTGKSDTALELAEKLGGEIINADSMQVYRYFDIGTAKPGPEARRRVPHHLIDILEPDEEFNAFDFKTLALDHIADLHRRGKIPILAGGTGLYIKVLTENHDCAVQVSDATLQSVREQIERDGLAACHDALSHIDPESAARITPADRLRIERALTVHLETGKKLSEFHAADHSSGHAFPIHAFLFEWDRADLYENINRRVDRMIGAGWVDEVRNLLARGYPRSLKPFGSIGYAELVRHLEGKISLERAVYEIKRETRHYAKRQITWFKKMPGILRLPALYGDTPGTLMEKILLHLPKIPCLLLALWFVLGPVPETRAEAPLQEGTAWLAQGRTALAANQFQSLLHDTRDRQMKKRARYLLGHTLFVQGRLAEAGRLLTESLADYPEIGDYIQLDLARLALAQGDGQTALGHIETLLDRFPESVLGPDARLLRIDILEQEGGPRKTIKALSQLLGEPANPSLPRDIESRLPELVVRLARLHQNLGQNGQAYQWLRHLYIAHPADPLAREILSDYHKLEALADVIPHPLSLAEADRRVRNLMGRALYQEALADLDALSRRHGELPDDFTFYRARAYQRTGQRPLADAVFDRFVQENPKHTRVQEALFEKGKNLWNLNRDAEALDALKEVLRKNKVSKWAMKAQYVISRIHESNRQYPLASRSYRALIDRYRHGRFVREAGWRLGWIDYRQGRFADAHRRFKDNALRFPYSSLVESNWYWAGKAAEKTGAAQEAVNIYQRLAELYPFSFFGLRARENLARLGGSHEEASGREAARIIPIAFSEPSAPAARLKNPFDTGDDFHLTRARELIALGFYPLARTEISRLEGALFRDLSGVMRLSGLYNEAHSHPDALRVLQIHRNSLSASRLRDLPESFWKNYYPLAYSEIIEQRAKDHGIDPFFVKSLIRQESLFDPRALSPAGARGLMQIMPETGRRVHGKTSASTPYSAEILFDPETNIDLGIQYLNHLMEKFGDEKAHVLISYNAGPHVLKKWLKRFAAIDDPDMFIESIPYPETRKYVKRVMGNYGVYKMLYSPVQASAQSQ
ncbi:MAG: tRNA (adenosine(37)-N6)-dimethylallyltransferase MiaA [Nitrospinaceae bacterium]|jgi:tRNA dimethylallyltransferase|nr:MAG: tRNA (adenosine(37)-N6)-dimethylallyltransferase MiaA [Nitrospinaceae bacterium]